MYRRERGKRSDSLMEREERDEGVQMEAIFWINALFELVIQQIFIDHLLFTEPLSRLRINQRIL